jgi:hypothetical protein
MKKETPAKGTFTMYGSGAKTPLGGKVTKGGDLRSKPGKNDGKISGKV